MNHRRAWARAVGLPLVLVVVASGVARGDDVRLLPDSTATAASCVVTIAPERQTLTLGTDTTTSLVVTATGPLAGEATAGRTLATVGDIGPLVPGPTPGSFTAEYRVPIDRRPQSAIVAAELLLPGGRRFHAVTRLMLPAETNFPLHSSPNASVSLEVAGHVFGPRKADAEGNVRIPIVVPPDVGVGHASAISEFGIEKRTEVSLQPQDYPRVLLIAPPDAEAGTDVDIEVWAITAAGDPSPPEEIDLWIDVGKLRRWSGVPGRAGFTLTLPGRVGEGVVALIGSMADGTSAKTDTIVVHTGPVIALSLSSDMSQLVVGSLDVARLSLVAQDRFGNIVSPHGVEITAEGRSLPIRIAQGAVKTELRAPARWPGRDRVTVKAALGQVHTTLDVALTGTAPARVSLTASRAHVAGDGRSAVDLLLEVSDQRGTPTSADKIAWRTENGGSLEMLAAPRFGAYAARFTPRHTLRDRAAVVVVAVDPSLTARARIDVDAGAARTGAARIGMTSNLGSLFGQAVFVETTVPLHRLGGLGRILSAGLSLGYVHSEMTTESASVFSPVHLDVSQAPILALTRFRVPSEHPVELSFLAIAGLTFATTEIIPSEGSFPVSRATAHGLVVGGGADATVVLQPGELVMGARYLYANLGRTSNGDNLAGNAMGLIFDIGFRIGF